MISNDFPAINLHLLIISCGFPATFKITLVPGTAKLPLVTVRPKQSPSSRSIFPSWLSDFWDVSWYHDSNHQRLISQISKFTFLGILIANIMRCASRCSYISARRPTNQDHLCPVNCGFSRSGPPNPQPATASTAATAATCRQASALIHIQMRSVGGIKP